MDGPAGGEGLLPSLLSLPGPYGDCGKTRARGSEGQFPLRLTGWLHSIPRGRPGPRRRRPQPSLYFLPVTFAITPSCLVLAPDSNVSPLKVPI